MRRAWLVLPALVIVLAGLIALAPGTWLDWAVQRYSYGVLGLADANGTLWQGRGTLQAILPSGRVETLEPVRWRVDPWALLSARVSLSVLSERDGKPVTLIALAPTNFSVTELRLDLPAALLGAASPTLREAGASGRLAIRASGVRIDADAVNGTAELLWRDAGSSLTTVHPLGTYKVDLKGTGRGLDYTLTTVSGALDLTGGGQWRPNAPLSFNATARPAPEQAERLVPLLRIIGKETGGDSYQIRLDDSAGLAGR